jgi:branched-chain amino acid transport system substrate-binding protein
MRWAGISLVFLGLMVVSSCNFVVDTSTDQCETTSDCLAKGPAFANSVCTSEKVCSTGGDCTTNQECITRNGAASICRRPEGTCIALKTAQCQEVFPEEALVEDQTIVLGLTAPLTGADATSGLPLWNGMKLALNEIETIKGIPQKNSTDRRRIVGLACDDAEGEIPVAEHLAKVVRVPGIVGSAFSGVTLSLATKVTIPSGTLIISPSATSPSISDLPDNGLVWRTAPSDALQAIPLAKLVADFEAETRVTLSLLDTDPIKVAMTVKGDAYGTGLANATTSKMVFNDKPAVENTNEFLRVDYPESGADFAQVTDEIVAFQPHIVLLIGTTESDTDILPGIEEKWTQSAYRPYHLVSDGGRIAELTDYLVGKDALRQRVLGTSPGRTTPLYQQFAFRVKGFLGIDPGTYADNAYDASYVMTYALVATSDQTPSGATINEGLKRMIGGAKIIAGPDDLNTGFSALLQPDGKIDYDGVSGPLDFDPVKGEADADIDVWCVVIDTANNPVFVSSGQYYDSITQSVVGTRSACD